MVVRWRPPASNRWFRGAPAPRRATPQLRARATANRRACLAEAAACCRSAIAAQSIPNGPHGSARRRASPLVCAREYQHSHSRPPNGCKLRSRSPPNQRCGLRARATWPGGNGTSAAWSRHR
eukprot:5819068-Prymnesium_polylepis.1